MNNLKVIKEIADAMNSGSKPPGVCLYSLGAESENPDEHHIFTAGNNPAYIGSIAKVGKEGMFAPFMHLEDSRMVNSL